MMLEYNSIEKWINEVQLMRREMAELEEQLALMKTEQEKLQSALRYVFDWTQARLKELKDDDRDASQVAADITKAHNAYKESIELINAAYETGYCQAILVKMLLTEAERDRYQKMQLDAVTRREAARKALGFT